MRPECYLAEFCRLVMRPIRFAGEGSRNLVGVGRAPDLICDLLQNGRINPATLEEKPLTFPEDGSVLDLVERLRDARVPMAIVNDRSGRSRAS